MIVKNEAERLRSSIESFREHADEIVVVDNGSTDATVEIARSMGARLDFNHGDFSSARNAALQLARGRFRLMIDADEIMVEDTWPNLDAFLREERYRVGRICQRSETGDGVVDTWVTRVCANDPGIHYEGSIHEQLVGDGSIGDTGLVVLHSGYLPREMAKKGTIARNLRLLKVAIEHHPGDPYLHFQLGRALVLAKDDHEALAHFEIARANVGPNTSFTPSLARELGYLLRQLGQTRKALEVVRLFQSQYCDYTDLFFLEGLCHMDLGNAPAMVRAFNRCLQLGEPKRYPTVRGVGTFRCYFNLGLYFELAGDVNSAIHHYDLALAADPSFAPAGLRRSLLGAPYGRRAQRGRSIAVGPRRPSMNDTSG
jgi:glycosyltransferase involved in cell wall biosynthesis